MNSKIIFKLLYYKKIIMSTKCSAFTKNKKCCKNKFKFVIENHKFCTQHTNIKYTWIQIQTKK